MSAHAQNRPSALPNDPGSISRPPALPAPYLRYPHLYADLVTFVAEDDVWIAPLSGGRAWRVSALGLPARNPRFSPDGQRLFWTVVQDEAPELVSARVDGGDFRRLTWFGHASTRLRGFTPAGEPVVISAFEQPDSQYTVAYAVAADGVRRALGYGPVDAVAYGRPMGDQRPVVLGSALSLEQAWWKRYRGGASGKLWIDRDGSGEFSRLLPELDGNLCDPLWVGDRIAFLSDHEGYGNLYSVASNGKKLRRHTDHEGFYVRHAAGDGERVVVESAGNLFLLDGLDAEVRQLEITLGSASAGRRSRALDVSEHLGEARPDRAGRSSLVQTHGTIHMLTHRDGPSRAIAAQPGVRARLARLLGEDAVVFIDDGPFNAGRERTERLQVTVLDAGMLLSTDQEEPGQGGGAASALKLADPEQSGPGKLPQPVSARSVNYPAVHSATADATEQIGGVSADEAENGVHGTDASGARTQRTMKLQGDSARAVRRSGTLGLPRGMRVCALEPSPDGRQLALSTEHGELFLVVLDAVTGDTGTTYVSSEQVLRRVTRTAAGAIEELVFSPDSRWLAWSEPMAPQGRRARLRLVNVQDVIQNTRTSSVDHSADDTGALQTDDVPVVEATDGRFGDFSPAFTPDGKFLAFLSRRSFDPVYDTHSFDLSFPQAIRPYLLALAVDTPSPFGPSVTGAPVQPAAVTPGVKEYSGAVPEVRLDISGLCERVISVPVAQGDYRRLRAADGALLWLEHDLEGFTGDGRASTEDHGRASRLVRFGLDERQATVLVQEADDYALSGDGRRVLIRRKGTLATVPSEKKADAKSGGVERTEVDLSRIRVSLEPEKVWGQAFDETWRLQRDFYWSPALAGLDWEDVYDRYRPLVERLGGYDDLVDLLWELQGELGTSHAYVMARPVREPGSAGAQGRLGAELVRRPEGGWVVAAVLPGESSDPQAFSPLSAPGADVRPGDEILAVDGRAVTGAGVEPLLAGAAGKVVDVQLRNGPRHGAQQGHCRRLAICPVKDEERLRYQDQVRRNRAFVRETSGGRFGYLHIPDMQARGWAQLHRDLESEFLKDAVVIDVRGNRGGHTSELVAEVIGRRITGWVRSRASVDGTYPSTAPRGPLVLLADEFAGSDGDIITQVTKLRGIGPVVGTRTWGGVVGIDGRFSLADGTGVTQPRYSFWFSGGVGWSVENHGVDPDIEVPFSPHAWLAGEDPQLREALVVLEEMLQEIPTAQSPARDGYRVLQPDPLPPRSV